MSSDKTHPLGIAESTNVDVLTRYRGHRLLREQESGRPSIRRTREEHLALFGATQPYRTELPSLPWRQYVRGDPVAVNEVVIRNIYSGEMRVVYPGSQERARFCWPTWQQIMLP